MYSMHSSDLSDLDNTPEPHVISDFTFSSPTVTTKPPTLSSPLLPGGYSDFAQYANTLRSPSAGPMTSSPRDQMPRRSPHQISPSGSTPTIPRPSHQSDTFVPPFESAFDVLMKQRLRRFIRGQPLSPEGPTQPADQRTSSPKRAAQSPVRSTHSLSQKSLTPERPTHPVYQRSPSPLRSMQPPRLVITSPSRSPKTPELQILSLTSSPRFSYPRTPSPAVSPHRRTPSPATSPYRRTPSPSRSAQSPYLGIRSPARSPETTHPRIPSPSTPRNSPQGASSLATSSHQRTPSPEPRTPSPKPPTRRRLFVIPSPVRPELVTPSPPTSTSRYLSGIGQTLSPESERQALSPDISSLQSRSSLESSLFRPQQVDGTEMKHPGPTITKFYASPGIDQQIVVSLGDSFMVDKDVPPEFRQPIKMFDVEDMFHPSELAGIPRREQEAFLMGKFYKSEYEKTLNELINAAQEHMGRNYFGEPSTLIIFRALNMHIHDLRRNIKTLEAENDDIKSQAVAATDRAEDQQRSIETLKQVVQDLERRLQEENAENKRLLDQMAELNANISNMEKRISYLVEVQPELRDEYKMNRQIQDELRMRAEAAEKAIKSMEKQLDKEQKKYARSLDYLVQAHKKMAEICEIKNRRYYDESFGLRDDPITRGMARYGYTDESFSRERPRNPERIVKEAIRDICLMAEEFAGRETPQMPEVAQWAVDRWHDLVEQEIHKNLKQITEMTLDRIAYEEGVMKEFEEKDKVIKLE